jgi:hypothetical protein
MRPRIVPSLPLLCLLVLATAGAGCAVAAADCIQPTGAVTREARTVGAFDQVAIGGAIELVVREGKATRVEVEAPADVLARVTTNVADGVLEIDSKDCVRGAAIKVAVTAPRFVGLESAGSGSIRGDGVLGGKRLALAVSGSGDIRLALAVGEVAARVSGSGQVVLRGDAARQSVAIDGSGSFDGRALTGKHGSVAVRGSGDVTVAAEASLAVEIAGSGSVRYLGRPSLTQAVSGSGSVRPAR